jgi:hypothetical protein
MVRVNVALLLPRIPKRYGRVSSNSVTNEASKFAGPHKSRMHQYIIELAHQGQMIGH